MPRNIPSGLNTHLQGENITIALCAKLTLRDGTVFGFTSNNSPMVIEGVDYEPNSTLSPSAMRAQMGADVDTLEVVGLIQSDRVTTDDIRAGRYAHAVVELFIVNYMDLTEGKLIIFEGWVGEVQWNDQYNFTFELRSKALMLSQQIVDLTSPKCRVRQLFNAKCFVSGHNFDNTHTPGDFQSNHIVSQVIDAHTLKFAGDSHADNYYSEGRVVFNNGANKGLEREVKGHSQIGWFGAQASRTIPAFLSIPDNAALSMGAGVSCTFAGWFRLDEHHASTGEVVFGKGGEYYISWSAGSDFWNFTAKDTTGSTASVVNIAAGSPTVGQWFFVVVTHESGNRIGISVNNNTFAYAAFVNDIKDDTGDFGIGYKSDIPQAYSVSAAYVGIWKRVLNGSEITSLYNGANYPLPFILLPGSLQTSLVAYWNLDEASSSIRVDSKGSNNLNDTGGVVLVTTGPGVTQAALTLHLPFPYPIAVGDQAMLEAGCDRLLATCRDKFANVGNYRGEPYIPGFDITNQRGRR